MCEGYVYILTNDSMPGLVKIGRSKHGGRVRAKDLYSQATGVPGPFKMEFEIWASDSAALEQYVHEVLEDVRVNSNREFFRMEYDVAIEIVMKCFGEKYDLHVGLSDFMITRSELSGSFSKIARPLIPEEYRNAPLSLHIATAIKNHLPESAVKEAITAYVEECEKRKKDMLGARIAEQ